MQARSSTHERKSKSYVLVKKDRLYLKHNTLSEDIPIVFVFKALGVQSDYETMLLVAGTDRDYQDLFSANFEDSAKHNIFSQQQALEYIGSRIRITRKPIGSGGFRRNYVQEALESLASVIVPHVPVTGLNFKPKVLYFAFMTRRVLMAMNDPDLVDDRDYVGNKRLEL
jgi:DNA-directed RNA polymerase III subunit RPC2